MSERAPIFELDRVLGEGTTGHVWHGTLTESFRDEPAGSEVAVKYLRPELDGDDETLAAFRREARAGREAAHPSLVRILHQGRDDRGPYLMMGHVPGESLRDELVRDGRLPEPLARSIGRRLAEGLEALHDKGWLHGDVKPDNVRLDSNGEAVLMDFGFARPVDGLDVCEGNPGSLAYLSPEQARGAAAGTASDVYALGVVLYELVTGELPFAAADGDRDLALAAIAKAVVEPPSEKVPRLSPFLDALLLELLSADPDARPSAAEVARRFDEGETGRWWRSRVTFDETRRDSAASGRHLLPLVGRDAELGLLVEAFETASAGDGGAVWLEGDPGSGKSRLVSEFVARMRHRDDPPLYLYSRCSERLEQRPGEPVRTLLRRFLHLPFGAEPGEREVELLEELVPPHVAETLIRSFEPTLGRFESGEPTALAQWLMTLAQGQPTIVFLDDVNWAGESTIDVLLRLVESLSTARLLLVIGQRRTADVRHPQELALLRSRLESRATVRSIALEPLDEDAVLEVVESLFHHTTPRLSLARVLHERSRGSPGLVAETLRSLLSRGEMKLREDGSYDLLITPDELPLPRSVSTLIAEQYRALPAAERLWLQRLSVVGGHIDRDFLLRAFPPASRAEVDGHLAKFERKGWLVAVGPRYRFARPAQREAVYRTIRERRRVRMHASAAAALAPRPGKRTTGGDAFQRAFHLRSAGEHEALLALVRSLIESLLDGGHPQRVHMLATWGLEAISALPSDPERDALRIDLLEAATDAADRLGYRDEQRDLLDDLSELDFDAEENPRAIGRVYLLHGRYAANVGQYGLARGMLRNATLYFQKARDDELSSEAFRRLSHVQGHVGEQAAAEELARRSLALAQSPLQHALSLLCLAVTDVLDNRFEAGLRHVDRAMKVLRRRDDATRGRGAEAAAYLLRSRIYRLVGRPRRAFAAIQRAARLANEAGERRLQTEIAARRGRLLIDVSRVHDAELELRDALLAAREIEYRRGEALAAVFLGTLLAEDGDPEGESMLERSAKLTHDMGLQRIEALCLALRARVVRQKADFHTALRYTEDAMGLLAQFGAELPDRVVIAGTRSLVLSDLGHRDEAREIERALERRVRRVNDRIAAPILRQRHRRSSRALLRAALSPTGPVYPRIVIEDL